jgi:hypothetical protein
MKLAVVLHPVGGRPEWPRLKSGERVVWGKRAKVVFTPASSERLECGGRVPSSQVNAEAYEVIAL